MLICVSMNMLFVLFTMLLTLASNLGLPIMMSPYFARVRATLRRRGSDKKPIP